jgi:hypothetical protein
MTTGEGSMIRTPFLFALSVCLLAAIANAFAETKDRPNQTHERSEGYWNLFRGPKGDGWSASGTVQ